MTEDYERLEATVSQALAGAPTPSLEELRKKISGLNDLITGGRVSPNDCEKLAREIETRHAVSIGLASVVDDGSLEPWLDDAKKDIDPYYWKRYKQLLVANNLPPDVITTLDLATDQILGRLGNPKKETAWDRRGMVVGHVQSGKTANYAGLICKAADAGYRLIIVIAGIHNNLRNQTQERIDEGFIGRDTGRMSSSVPGSRTIGVGRYDDGRPPVSLTTSKSDFNKTTATNNRSQIGSYNVPVVLVIKKNPNTLRNLIDWLRENSARGDAEMIDQPMLVIDDEADNASINTRYSKNEVTTINGQIRDLLQIFHRSCYVAYTATPFANIFIDPDEVDEMLGEDLFPKHFIIGLDTPSNYFGGKKVFIEGLPDDGPPEFLRFIDDNEDILPIVHKIDMEVSSLPASLVTAVRAFLIARTLRNLRGQGNNHCSMLVNASRFTRVQGLLRNRLHETLDLILNSIRVNGLLGERALSDPEIAALYAVWKDEYSHTEFEWSDILPAMFDAVAGAKVVEVNSSSNGLDYNVNTQTVIAVGGFSLSRGLTLEGLMVTWFLRNTKMYDTLMQMGRWFGYRHGYQDLCRIWMPREAVAWYSHIADATEELHAELGRMDQAKLTPMDFGLAVRADPSTLMVTARNKVGSSKEITVRVGLSERFVETARVRADRNALDHNRAAAKQLISNLSENGYSSHTAIRPSGKSETPAGGYLLREVPVSIIEAFLINWINADQNITTQTSPILDYILSRKVDELAHWDLHIAGNLSGEDCEVFDGWPIVPRERTVLLSDLTKGFLSFGGEKMRVSDRADERIGIPSSIAEELEREYRAKNQGVNYPGRIYRTERTPLFSLYVVKVKRPKDEEEIPSNFPHQPVIAWSISFPKSAIPDKRVDYVINKVKQRELFGDPDEDDDING
jgi:hypothetical protein